MKILIVDDTPMNAEVLSKMLREKGFEVILASDGNQGLDILKKEKFDENDLILVDVNMPGMNGFEFVENVKRSGGKSDMKMYSAMKPPIEFKTMALRAGASGISELNSVMDSVFNRLDNLVNQTQQKLDNPI